MRIVKRILIILSLFIPFYINAETFNFNDGVKEGNNYIKSTKYNTRGKYLIMSNQKFIMNDDGTLSTNSDFYNGGFLNRLEYCISTGNSNCNGSSYLMIPASYWTLSSNSTSRYYINNVSGLNIQSDTYSSGVRVTEFVKPQISVTGSGTYNNPWVFDNTYLVNLRTNNKKLGYFGSESEKKTSEQKYATDECLKGNKYCTNFDITVARGYGNNSKDGCNLKFIKNGEKRGSSVVKTYEISNIKSDISCVAIFEEDKFTIKFDSNGGTGEMPELLARYGHNIDLTNKFTREYYEFIGWNTAADGSGVSWPAESIKFENVAGEKGIDQSNNLTLYAQWKQKIIWEAVATNKLPKGTLAYYMSCQRSISPWWDPIFLLSPDGVLYRGVRGENVAMGATGSEYWDRWYIYKLYDDGEYVLKNVKKYSFSPHKPDGRGGAFYDANTKEYSNAYLKTFKRITFSSIEIKKVIE